MKITGSMKLEPCDCGYGPGWYHSKSGITHEYNPDVPEKTAAGGLWGARRAPGIFYLPWNTPEYVQAEILSYYPEGSTALVVKTLKAKKFTVAKYKTEVAAMRAAAAWVENQISGTTGVQESLFNV